MWIRALTGSAMLVACTSVEPPPDHGDGRDDAGAISTHTGEVYRRVIDDRGDGHVQSIALGDDGYFRMRVNRASGCTPQGCGRWAMSADGKTFTFDTYLASTNWASEVTEDDGKTCKMEPPPSGQIWIDRWTREEWGYDATGDGRIDEIYRWTPIGSQKASQTRMTIALGTFPLYEGCTVRPDR